MKSGLVVLLIVFALTSTAFAAGKGPEINLVDSRLSINAEAISLGRLLRLLDLATGMQSKVPPDLASRNISVRFSGLTLEDGVRKIFQGQPFDYVVLEHQGIIVTSAAQAIAGSESTPAFNPAPQQPGVPQPNEQPFVPDFPPAGLPQPGQPLLQQQLQQQQQQPAMIQTPFGPIANPRAGQPIQPVPPVQQPVVPQNPLFPGANQQQQQQPSQGLPGTTPGMPTPFGAMPSQFGTPQSPNNSNNLFRQ